EVRGHNAVKNGLTAAPKSARPSGRGRTDPGHQPRTGSRGEAQGGRGNSGLLEILPDLDEGPPAGLRPAPLDFLGGNVGIHPGAQQLGVDLWWNDMSERPT